jgi:hypothetical protein
MNSYWMHIAISAAELRDPLYPATNGKPDKRRVFALILM